ncbi:MAG TPA: hypothetical protein VMP11_14300 [Verrucomicrobiae bacterium]|nr:hypothetical protein [Verrucomicrobiae bacterium]
MGWFSVADGRRGQVVNLGRWLSRAIEGLTFRSALSIVGQAGAVAWEELWSGEGD